MTAKPAGEPRPRWTHGSVLGNQVSVNLFDRGRYVATIGHEAANKLVAALNAAETHAAQPGDAPKLTADELNRIMDLAAEDAPKRAMFVPMILERINALLASRSTPAAPAPGSTEAPGAPDKNEMPRWTLSRYTVSGQYQLMRDDKFVAMVPNIDDARGLVIALSARLTFHASAAPSTEALIATGDALRANMMNLRHADGSRAEDCTTCKRLDAEWRAARAALAAALRPALSPDAAASSGDDKGEGR